MALGAALALLLLAPAARALEVREVRWGFDGRVVQGRVNILSVLLANPTDSAFDGELRLRRADMVVRGGAPQSRKVFLAPGSQRLVQFYLYLDDERESWELVWRDGRYRLSSDRLVFGPPAVVLLERPGNPFTRPAGLRTMPDDLFPTTVGATDGLWAVALDHAPQWRPARRQAFLDWLRRGGTVHLLYGSEQSYPRFTAELAVLNNPARRFRVGAGLVRRHPVGREGLEQRRLGGPVMGEENATANLDRQILSSLTAAASPKHAWWLIFLLLLAYIAVIGPANLVFARKVKDYRHAFVFLAGAVGLFALVLYFVGRRGYGEVAGACSLSYARPVAPGQYDVTQWANAFVTSSGIYKITYDSPQGIFSTCADLEAVPGLIRNGPGAAFVVEMPLFSSRAFLFRGRLPGPRLVPRLVRYEGPAPRRLLTVRLGPEAPEDILGAYLLEGPALYELRAQAGELRRDWIAPPKNAETALNTHTSQFESWQVRRNERDADLRERILTLMPALAARAIWAPGDYCNVADPDRYARRKLQLFVLARSPRGFHCSYRGLGRREGYVLYHFNIRRPEDSDG